MELEEKIIDVLNRHGPRTKKEIVKDCGYTTAEEVEQCEQAVEKLASENKLYMAHEDRSMGKGISTEPANNPVVFLTREWYKKCKENSAYAFLTRPQA